MRTILFATALLAGTAALAQDVTPTTSAEPETNVPAETTPDAQAGMTDAMPATTDAMTPTVATAAPALPSTGSVQAPGNTDPQRDARGIAVLSDPANVPAGYNGTGATGVGGPAVDSADAAATTSDASHPPCTREVTDNCVQTYERRRSPQ